MEEIGEAAYAVNDPRFFVISTIKARKPLTSGPTKA
jgi:hypothetical protein